ncbi:MULTISPECIES: hypothetical protein [unclassified Chamaesiphon]|uniref:hypothetical protein n=1 Tax=unclassified Chamaesiphon TaxID=2620921 RepID=UPI00286B45B2|nr:MULTISPECIES: hypothetical protein [unclassified Chamaesiphon]
MRSAIRSSIQRLATAHPPFKTELIDRLIPLLLAPEQPNDYCLGCFECLYPSRTRDFIQLCSDLHIDIDRR